MKALLVDLYETLVWTDWQTLGDRMTRLLEVDGPTLLRAFQQTHVGRGCGHFGSLRGDLAAIAAAAGAPQAGPRGDAGAGIALEVLERELLAFLSGGVHLYDDVRPALRALRAAGTRVAIVSNCDHATRPVLDRLGLEREVDATVLSCEVGSLKPDAAIFETALARLGVAAREAVFVDDQPRYLDGARALGIRTVRIARRPAYEGSPEASETAPHPVIPDLTALPHCAPRCPPASEIDDAPS